MEVPKPKNIRTRKWALLAGTSHFSSLLTRARPDGIPISAFLRNRYGRNKIMSRLGDQTIYGVRKDVFATATATLDCHEDRIVTKICEETAIGGFAIRGPLHFDKKIFEKCGQGRRLFRRAS